MQPGSRASAADMTPDPTDRPAEKAAPDRAGRRGPGLGRYALVAAIVALVATVAYFAGQYLGFETLAENYVALTEWRDQNWALSIGAFFLVYVAAVAFSVPGAVWLTLLGGFLFGTVLGSGLVVTAATTGAVLVFLVARTALGEILRTRAQGWLSRMEKGFREGEISYLLIMRLVPAIPFFVANLVPAFLGARLWTFLWTTFVGIMPGTIVYISIGAGLGEQLSRGEAPDLGVIFEPHVLGPLLGLALLAALPLILKRLGVRRRP